MQSSPQRSQHVCDEPCFVCRLFPFYTVQEGICMTLEPEFHFLEVAYPYVARWVGCPGRLQHAVHSLVTQCGRLQLC